MEQITGSVTRLVFRNAESTYTVLRLAPDQHLRVRAAPALPAEPSTAGAFTATAGAGDAAGTTSATQASFIENDNLPKLITVVGDFTTVEVGQQLWVLGEWREHPMHGRQFRANQWKVQLPTTLVGMQAYLASGLVRGIGPALASAIVQTFGEDTFDIIENEPERLRAVPGIGAVLHDVLVSGLAAVTRLMAFLQGQGLPPTLALKICRALGPAAGQIVQTHPYRLTEVRGVGFKTADHSAAEAGLPRDSGERLAAGLHLPGGRQVDDYAQRL